MPLRGESVGTAYVRIVADGTGIPQDIRDAFDDDNVDHEIQSVGERHGKAYEKGFKKELEDSKNLHLGAVLERALGQNAATNDFFANSPFWKNFKKDVDEEFEGEFRSVARLAVESLEDEFKRKGSLTGIDNEVEGFVGRVSKLRDQLSAERSAAVRAAEKDMSDFERNFRSVINETEVVSQRSSQISERAFEDTKRGFEDLGKSVFTTTDGMRRDFHKFDDAVKRDGHDAVTVFGSLGKVVDGLAEKTGRTFGKGSRNNFLNFTGSFIEGGVKLLGLFPKLLDNVGQLALGFGDALQEGKGFFDATKSGFSAMTKDAEGAGTSLSEAFSSIVIAAPVIAAALVGIVGILSIVASLASGIAAALTAIVATLSFAAVGAIAPLVGLLGPLVVVVGAAIAGVVSFGTQGKKAMDNFKAAVKPVIDAFKELGKFVRLGFQQTFDTKSLNRVLNLMKQLAPLFETAGEAFGILANQFSHIGESAAFKRFINVMALTLPKTMGKLGKIAANVGEALLNIFVDLNPTTQNFLNWLVDITGRFADWTSSVKGNRAIHNFFKDAADSLAAVGDLAGPLLKVIGTLLSAGKSTGDSIFTSLGEQVQKFSDFLDKHPKGLSDFFKNGEQVASDLGGIALALIEIFDALDTPEGRKNLHTILHDLGELGKLAGPLGAVARVANVAIGGLLHLLPGEDQLRSAEGVIRFFRQLPGVIGRAIRALGNTIGDHNPFVPLSNNAGRAARAVGRFMAGIPGAVGNAIRAVGNFIGSHNPFNPLSQAAGVVAHAIGHLFSQAATNVIDAISHMASTVGTRIAGIPGRLSGLASQFGSLAQHWADNIYNAFVGLPAQIAGIFSGLGALIRAAIGTITPHVSLHVPGTNINIETASGGIFDGAQTRIIGEAGREAVVPLDRPLSQVDPSVRWLSAIAQGLSPGQTGATAVQVPGKTVTVTQHITTPTTDTVGVAREVVNQLVAAAY